MKDEFSRMKERERKLERSIAVQARVDIITLADIAVYLTGLDVRVGTMSMLVSLGLEIAENVLKRHKLLTKEHEEVGDAHNTLLALGLYQKSMLKRAERKITTAIGFEELRKEGIDPQGYVPQMYNSIHRQDGRGDSVSGIVKKYDMGEKVESSDKGMIFKDPPTLEELKVKSDEEETNHTIDRSEHVVSDDEEKRIEEKDKALMKALDDSLSN